MSAEEARAADEFAVAYARKYGARPRVRADIWLKLKEAGADVSLYICMAQASG